ncbi:hypothetical protein [Nonomuraea sp. NPDC050786]|uniref:hypothetical protein n=1 Tax=Nonomuraea sp. NPDC050786 TaxID=3154840 RepID=UPI0033F18017
MTYPLPFVDAEIAFTSGSNSTQYLTLDDPVRGKLDVGKLAPGTGVIGGEIFESVSTGGFLSACTITRGATRLDGPMIRYETGNASLTLRNEDRRFDPTNLDGPYVIGTGVNDTGTRTFVCSNSQMFGHGVTVAVESDPDDGPAEVRGWTGFRSGTTSSFTVDKPAVAVGDVMLCFHTGDIGLLTNMTITGGATWLSLGTIASPSNDTLKTRVWWKIATSADTALPATNSYTLGQVTNCDSVGVIISVRFADTSVTPVIDTQFNNHTSQFETPAVTPTGPSGIDFRWVAGTVGGAGASWEPAAATVGYTERSDLQSNEWTTGALYTKDLVAVGAGETQITPMRAARILATWGTEANYITNSLFQVFTGDGGGTLDGWQAGTGTTISSTSDRAYLGGYSVKLAKASGSTFTLTQTSSAYFSAPGGRPVTISFWIYIPAAAYAGVTGLRVQDAAGDASIADGTLAAPPSADQWHRAIYTTTVADMSQLRGIRIQVLTNGSHSASSTIAYVDAVQVVTASRPERFTWNRQRHPMFRGFVDHWEVKWSMENGPLWSEVVTPCSDAFKYFANFTRIAQELPVGAGEDTGQRVHRILDQVEWPEDERVVDAGDSVLQGTVHDGDALGELQQSVESELGELYMDGSGKVVFRRRNAVLEEERSLVPQWVFGDDVDNPQELPWADLVVSYDDAQLYNLVEEAMVGGETQTVQDVPSRTRNLTRPFSRTDLLLTSDAEVLSHATMILAMSKDPELRFDALTINAYKDPYRLFPALLSIRIGDRLRIYRRPPGGGLPIIRDVIVRGISHNIGQVQWETTFTLQSATKYSDVTPF